MSQFDTLCAAFQSTAARLPGEVALRTPADAATVTWRQYADRVGSIAAGLAALGVGRGDTVAIMLANRPEFHLVDTAVLHLGAAPFSVYNTLAPDQLSFVFANAGNKVVVTEARFVAALREAGPDLTVVCLDDGVEGTRSLADVEAAAEPDFDVEAAWRAVEPDDLATIIYTSGTTGPPKGVELTHRNLLAVTDVVDSIFAVNHTDRNISFLPSAHIADRAVNHYSNMVFGMQVTCVDDPRALAAALADTRPTLLFAVPRVLQKVKLGVESALAAEPSGPKRKIAAWALDIGRRVSGLVLAGQPLPLALAVRYRVADKLVLSKLRERLGLDKARFVATGAAAAPVEILRFFWSMNVEAYEIWGMSETGGLGAVTRPGKVKLGTVGPPVPGTEVKLAADGEMLIRGDSVMRGYRGDPARTAETVDDDGWVHTGDIGTVDDDGFYTIIDRKKELIINSSGKNMSPTNIENAIKAAGGMVGQVVAIGDDRPYVTALVVLDPDAATGLAKRFDLADASLSAVAGHAGVRDLVAGAVRAGNTKLSRVEQVKRFRIVPANWEPGGDELTPTLKLRRKPIAEKYAHEIADLYAPTPGPDVIDLAG